MTDIKRAFDNCGIEYNTEYPLAERSFAKIGGKAKIAVLPKNEGELIIALDALKSFAIPSLAVGGLSNTLVSDGGFNGAVIFTDALNGFSIGKETVELSAGVRLSRVFDALSVAGVSAFEPFYGIPGYIGGMVYNNAGAFGAEISDIFVSARIYDTESGKIKLFGLRDMEFSYRDSILKKNKNLVLLSASFAFDRSDEINIRERVRELAEKRRAAQPLNYPSLGSVFKRPSVGFAGEYIERAGLKGYTVGGARISEKHAGFIVNIGGATSDDFISLMMHAEKTVFEKYGIRLEREIELLG